jgi:aldose 1-epimerase
VPIHHGTTVMSGSTPALVVRWSTPRTCVQGSYEEIYFRLPASRRRPLCGPDHRHQSSLPQAPRRLRGRRLHPRIGKGKFTLDGKKVQLDLNNNGNTLHGGTTGFDRLNWTGKQIPDGVELTLVSKDGDMGFPGTLTAHVRYTLSGDKLRIDYSATTDKPTVVNLTNHSYFNLSGHNGSILEDTLMIDADRYTPIDAGLIPAGPLAPVAGTPFDFRKPTIIGARINTVNEQLKLAGGYDHNWILNPPHTLAKPAAVLTDPGTGRVLKVFTLEPGLQFYSGNFLDGTLKGKDGTPYNKYAGLCLETQHFPDSPNRPDFPSTTLLPGHEYKTTTIFEFTTTKK